MKALRNAAAILLLVTSAAYCQVIIADNSDVTGSGTGFTLDSGINTGINPPTNTRLTGTEAAGLQYLQTVTGKAAANYTITGGKQQIAFSANSGRYTLSANGTTAFNFASALGTAFATPANPVVYDIGLSMANNNSGVIRFSFGLGTAEIDANSWDFGLQLYRTASGANTYNIGKRIDRGSFNGATSSDATGDLNASIVTTAANTYGTELNFIIRVTDAGAESGANYNSKIQISQDGGTSWFYDTSTDAASLNRWRLDGPDRFFSFDQAGGSSGSGGVTYDNFSVTIITAAVPEPSTFALGLVAAVGALVWRRRQ